MPTVVQQRGFWFEELDPAVVYRHSPGRTVNEADNTLFSMMPMNPQALHLDAAFSAETEFGERLVNSLLTMAVLVGLSVGHLTQGTMVATLASLTSGFRRLSGSGTPSTVRPPCSRSGCRGAGPARAW